jgi:hypothetical protein
MRWGVRPGIVVSSELCARAHRSDGVGGEHSAWWMKHACSPTVEVDAMLATMAMRDCDGVVVFVGRLLGCRGIIDSPLCMHFLPHIIVRPRCVMVHPILVNSTSHPALHSVTTLIRECDAKPGMMWAMRAVAGRLGRSNVPVWVDHT